MYRASRSARAAGVAALVGFGVAACGGARHSARGASPARTRIGADQRHQNLRPLPLVGGALLSTAAPASLRQGALPSAGATQRVQAAGARLAVTVLRVIDPLRASGADLPPGTRAVGVLVRIRSSGPKLYDSSATGDIRLQASGGVVAPVLATRGICRTPLEDFDRYITAGEDRVGCVVFAVANGATLDAVWFSPHAHRLGRLTWAP